MIEPKRVRAMMLVAFLEWVPPIIRSDLLADEKLREDFDLDIDPELNLDDASMTFKRSALFSAVRAAGVSPGKVHKVLDLAGTEWEIIAKVAKGAAGLTMKSGSRSLNAPHLLLLTKNKSARKQFFAREADRLNLPSPLTKRWSGLLHARALSDQEFEELMAEELRTPVAVTERMLAELRKPTVSIEILVPRSLDYYEQLVGRLAGQANIKEYVEEVATEHTHRLLEWRMPDGLHQALLMCSHSLITNALAKEAIVASEFNRLAIWAQSADAIARTAALELAVRRPSDRAKIADAARALAERFTGKGTNERCDPFTLLSAAFVMVDGELGKVKTLASKPPFWRRLAALSHAALITRCVLSTGGDPVKFIKWMGSVRSDEYIAQGYVDLRREPRWLADFAMPGQLKDELGGRVLVAAAREGKSIDKLGLRDILMGDAPRSLKKQLDLFSIQFPGPLEGNVDFVTPLAPDLLVKMREGLGDPAPSVSSFILVANAALLFQLPQDVPELAADAIRRAQYRLDAGGKPEQLQRCLVGLATVAAIYRNHRLADELFILIRSYRRLLPHELDLDDVFRVGMIACASRADLDDWCKCVGAFFTDLGFGELTRKQAAALHPFLIDFCELVPELWATCGQAIAAIEAVGLP
jgi:hypothetical protein